MSKPIQAHTRWLANTHDALAYTHTHTLSHIHTRAGQQSVFVLCFCFVAFLIRILARFRTVCCRPLCNSLPFLLPFAFSSAFFLFPFHNRLLPTPPTTVLATLLCNVTFATLTFRSLVQFQKWSTVLLQLNLGWSEWGYGAEKVQQAEKHINTWITNIYNKINISLF